MKQLATTTEKIQNIDDVDAIISYLTGKDEGGQLSNKQKQLFDRYDFADNQIRNLTKESEVVSMLCKKFDISPATAYRDIKNTKRVFGSISRQDKEYYRRLVIELCFDNIKLSKFKGDGKAVNGAISNLIKATGLTSVDIDLPDFEKLAAHEFEIVMPVEQIAYLQQMISSGAFNLGDMRREIPKLLDITHLQNGTENAPESQQ